MSTYFLVNAVSVVVPGAGALRMFPGSVVDDAKTSITTLRALGAELWPSTAPFLAAASLRVSLLRRGQGIDEAKAEQLMRSAAQQQLLQLGVREVSGTVAVLSTDGSFGWDLTSAVGSAVMPTTPYDGETHSFTDSKQQSAVHNLTISNGTFVQDNGTTASTYVLATAGKSVTFRSEGGTWVQV